MTSESLLWAQTTIFNQNQLIQKHPRISRIFIQWYSRACYQRKPSFSIKINRFKNASPQIMIISFKWRLQACFERKTSFSIKINRFLPTHQIIWISLIDFFQTFFKPSHHFQSKSTDFNEPFKSAGFLSLDTRMPVFSPSHHFQRKSTDWEPPPQIRRISLT